MNILEHFKKDADVLLDALDESVKNYKEVTGLSGIESELANKEAKQDDTQDDKMRDNTGIYKQEDDFDQSDEWRETSGDRSDIL